MQNEKLREWMEKRSSLQHVQALLSFDPKRHQAYVKRLIEKLGVDFEAGTIAESEHPFAAHFHNHDVRFTNDYHPDNLHSVFSAICEIGHSLYERGIRDDLSGTSLSGGISASMYEG